MSCRVRPSGTSTRPVLATLPTREKTTVPALFSVPMPAYQSAPWLMITGTVASVLTLLMTVGFPHSPLVAGKGGLGRGSPNPPSMEARRAVSSPQTKAPAPRTMVMSKLKLVPKTPSPNSPNSSARATAWVTRSTASGYSSRT